MWCSQRPVKDIRFPGTRISGDGIADRFHYWHVVCEGGLTFGRGHVLSERRETVPIGISTMMDMQKERATRESRASLIWLIILG